MTTFKILAIGTAVFAGESYTQCPLTTDRSTLINLMKEVQTDLIESGRQAIDFAKRNAANQKFANAKFFAEEVGRNRKRIPIGANTTVIVDPPRDGLEPCVAEWLAASKAPRIIYVSCDPATLIRDLRVITRNYDVAKVQWFNMFPRTARFETMVVLDKKA